MRRLKLAAALALLVLFAAQAQAEGLRKIAENVYAYAGATDYSPRNSFGANAGVVVTKEGVVVIDTLISAKAGRRLMADIRKLTPLPVRYVVLTHGHLDHALGASVFTDKGAVLVAQELERESLIKNGEAGIKRAASYGLTPAEMTGTRVALPSLTFTEKLILRLGGQSIELIHPGPTHSPGSILVLLPEQKVLFTGDILFTGVHPFLGEGDIPGWTRTLERIAGMDLAVIVPGHGPLSTRKDVADMRDYITLFDAKARELAPQAKDAADLAAKLKPLLPARAQGDFLIQFSLATKYLPAK